MEKSLLAVIAIATVLVFLPTVNSGGATGPSPSYLQQQDDGCSLPFAGKARKAVKLRAPNLNYPRFNNGDPISVKDFLEHVCTLTSQIPAHVPATKPMGMEKLTMTVRGFVMAMKRDPDNDLHIQIADKASPYRQPQIIVEIPPTKRYCADARSKMMKLYRDDSGKDKLTSSYVFNDPPQVEFTGYLFLDSTHGASCTSSGGRGIKNRLKNSPVKGTWELHPVISLN